MATSRVTKIALFALAQVGVMAADSLLSYTWPAAFTSHWSGGYWSALVTVWFWPSYFGLRRD